MEKNQVVPDHSGKTDSTPQERRAWLRAWAEQNPRGTIDAAKKALRAQFGVGVGTEAVASIIREVQTELLERGKASAEPETIHHTSISGIPSSIPAVLFEIVALMRRGGIRRVEILPTGSVLFGT